MNTTKRKCTAVIILLVLSVYCFLCGNPISAQAASTTMSISVSSSSVTKGSTVTVTVTVKCSEALGAYSYCLSYDSSILEYSSGDGYGGGGTISCAGYGDGSAKSASNSFTFTANAAGTAHIATSSSDVYTWDESNCSVSDAGTNITVNVSKKTTEATTSDSTTEASTGQDGSTEATSETSTEATTEETTEEISDNCFLSTLQITPGELTPEFSKEVYTYETTVSGDTTSLAINALSEDEKSSVTIAGNENFEPGTQAHITITVTAESGDSHIYDLLVHVEELVDTRAVIQIGDTSYYFTQDYSKINVPEGFSQSTSAFGDTEVILYTSPNGAITCAYLTDQDGNNGGWYIVDLASQTASPMVSVSSAYKTFIILTPDDSVTIPDGYGVFTYSFDGVEASAYRLTEDDDIFLVYAMDPDSDTGWYRYDTVTKTFVRYIEDPELIEGSPDDADSFYEQHKDAILTACIVVMILMFLAIVILACVLVHTIRRAASTDEESDEAYDDFEETYEYTDTQAAAQPERAPRATLSASDSIFNEQIEPQAEESAISEAPAPENSTEPSEDAPEESAPAEAVETDKEQEPSDKQEQASEDLTELKAEPSATKPQVSAASLKKPAPASPTDEIVKKAAQYSSMNTADLSEVFQMAEHIAGPEHDGTTKETGTLQFTPIKQNAPKEDANE